MSARATAVAAPAPHDVREGLRRLSRALKRVRYPERLSLAAASAGDAAVYLPMLRFLLSGYSKHVSSAFSSPAYRFATHALDAQFCDNALRAVRDVLGIRGRLTTLQFMAPGFGEHKMVFVAEVAARCADMHDAAERAAERAALRVLPHVAPTLDTPTLLHRRYSTSVMRPASAAPPGRTPSTSADRVGFAPSSGKLSPGKVCSAARCFRTPQPQCPPPLALVVQVSWYLRSHVCHVLSSLLAQWFSDAVALGRGAWASTYSKSVTFPAAPL
jgi:hypothetical protein